MKRTEARCLVMIVVSLSLLIGATGLTIEEIVRIIHRLGGLAIASHIDREAFSVVGQLGLIPEGIGFDKDGNPSTNSADVLDGSVSTLAKHKEFGLSLLVQLLGGPFSMAGINCLGIAPSFILFSNSMPLKFSSEHGEIMIVKSANLPFPPVCCLNIS